MNIKTEYKPSLVCRIIGHKWWLGKKDEWIDKDGRKHRKVTWTQREFCERCGFLNPGWED